MSNENTGHLASQADVNALRAHVDAKFEGLTGWIERVSAAVERLADQRERVAVVETTQKSHTDHIANLWKADSEKSKAISELRTEMTKLVTKVGVYIGIVAFAATFAGQIAVRIWF